MVRDPHDPVFVVVEHLVWGNCVSVDVGAFGICLPIHRMLSTVDDDGHKGLVARVVAHLLVGEVVEFSRHVDRQIQIQSDAPIFKKDIRVCICAAV